MNVPFVPAGRAVMVLRCSGRHGKITPIRVGKPGTYRCSCWITVEHLGAIECIDRRSEIGASRRIKIIGRGIIRIRPDNNLEVQQRAVIRERVHTPPVSQWIIGGEQPGSACSHKSYSAE